MDGTDTSDAKLMERVAAGDRGAFAQVIRRHQGPVLSVAYRYLGRREDAEEAAQEVFIRLWRAARRYRPDKPLPAYLRTLTVNFCLDLIRKPRLVALPDEENRPSDDEGAYDAVRIGELSGALGRALDLLPQSQRMAVVLFHLEGLTMKETADAMGTSPKAVESLLTRARASLRKTLGAALDAP